MPGDYFRRITMQTPTRLWINNPSAAETEQAIEAGAISCTTNPTYGAKLLKSEPEAVGAWIDDVIAQTEDDNLAAERVYERTVRRLTERFLPLNERSGGTQGFVTLQDDPRKDEDANDIITAALRHRWLGPNFMTKIPVTQAGLQAMEALIAENIPICATEVFSLDQAVRVCELYARTAQQTDRYPPFTVTHITGIFDEYLEKLIGREGIEIAPSRLAWAGATVGREEYHLIKRRGYPTTLLGGGARNIRHFTDFVGGDFHITINWSTAEELIAADMPVISRIDAQTPPDVLAELTTKLPDFRRAFTLASIPVEEFAEYGPVQLFRSNFIAGYERLLTEIKERRALRNAGSVPALASGG